MSNQKQDQVVVDINKTTEVKCKCNNDVFVPGVIVRKISKFLTGGTKDSLFPIQIMICSKCSEPLEDTIPEELK